MRYRGDRPRYTDLCPCAVPGTSSLTVSSSTCSESSYALTTQRQHPGQLAPTKDQSKISRWCYYPAPFLRCFRQRTGFTASAGAPGPMAHPAPSHGRSAGLPPAESVAHGPPLQVTASDLQPQPCKQAQVGPASSLRTRNSLRLPSSPRVLVGCSVPGFIDPWRLVWSTSV